MQKKQLKKGSASIFTYILVGLCFIGIVYSLQKMTIHKTHIVTYSSQGFSPNILNIQIGDTVIFRNKTSTPIFPASDPHPTHDFLMGFEAKKPLGQDDEFSFVFHKKGGWFYHDHLQPNMQGKIIVGSARFGKLYDETKANCEDAEDKERCYSVKIRTIVTNEGVDAGFAVFSGLYSSGETLGCHWTSHLIGEAAYTYFASGKPFTVTNATAYCGYGFYHGFMEKLMRSEPNTKKAYDFCEYVGKQLGNEGKDNCYHGIGHGFTEEPPKKEYFGNPGAMLSPGLTVCEKLFGKTRINYDICATGVYTQIAKFMENGKYGLTLDRNDPFSFCRTQQKEYDNACYGEFAGKLATITNWEVNKIPDYLPSNNSEVWKEIILTSINSMLRKDISLDSHEKYQVGCNAFKNTQKDICIEAVVRGLIGHGEPEKEYVKTINFCTLPSFTAQEKNACLSKTLSILSGRYSEEKISAICKSLGEEYHHLCN